MASGRCPRFPGASCGGSKLGLQLLISLLLHHACLAQQLSTAAPVPAGDFVTTTVTTTTTKTISEVTEETITPAAAAAARSHIPQPASLPAGTQQQVSHASTTAAAPSSPAVEAAPSGSTRPSTAAKPASTAGPAAAAAGANGTSAVTSRVWRPQFPFTQCANTTLSYDVSFVGALRYIQVGPVRYAYHRFGPLRPSTSASRPTVFSNTMRSNAPVMFLSGWGTSMYMWPVPMLQRLADTREVVIFDLMRTGLSTDSSNATLSIPLMANSTAALITQLGLKQPDLWAWSVGGMVAYALLALHSAKIGNVIIAAASPGGPDALLPPSPLTQRLLQVDQNYTELLPFLFPEGVKDPGVCVFYAAYNSFYASKFTALSTPLGEQAIIQQSNAVVKFFNDATIIKRLEGVTNRVLILHGVQDQLMPVRNALLGAWKLLGSWMLQFPGEGHGIPFSHVQGVITMTLEFFGFANPLTQAEVRQWANYGTTAAARSKGQDADLVLQAQIVKPAATGR